MNSNAPRPLESDPPSADDGSARAPRVSRHKLRLPNDLTSMDAPDDTFSPDDASVTDRAMGPSPTIPSAPPEPIASPACPSSRASLRANAYPSFVGRRVPTIATAGRAGKVPRT